MVKKGQNWFDERIIHRIRVTSVLTLRQNVLLWTAVESRSPTPPSTHSFFCPFFSLHGLIAPWLECVLVCVDDLNSVCMWVCMSGHYFTAHRRVASSATISAKWFVWTGNAACVAVVSVPLFWCVSGLFCKSTGVLPGCLICMIKQNLCVYWFNCQ